jgi:hypothetical protein
MLRITLEREQTNLFPQQHSSPLNYKSQVVNQEPFAEIKLNSISGKKSKAAKRPPKKTAFKQETMFLFPQ